MTSTLREHIIVERARIAREVPSRPMAFIMHPVQHAQLLQALRDSKNLPENDFNS